MRQRALLQAIAASLLLHALILLRPLWQLPQEQAPASPTRLQARLALPPIAAPTPTPAAPRRQADRPRPGSPDNAGPGRSRIGPSATLAPEQAESAPPLPPPTAELTPPVIPHPVPDHAEPPFGQSYAAAEQGQIVFQVIMGRQGLIVGRTTHTWQRQGEHYTLKSVTTTTGLAALFRRVEVTQISHGRVSATGLVPERYQLIQDEQQSSTQFDWPAQRLMVEHQGRKTEYPLNAGSQDLLSFIYQLVLHRPEGRTPLHVATGKKYNHYQLEYRGEENLEIAGKTLPARYYITLGPPEEQSTEVWLAPELAYLPVSVRFTERGGQVFDMIATDLDFGPTQRQTPAADPLTRKP